MRTAAGSHRLHGGSAAGGVTNVVRSLGVAAAPFLVGMWGGSGTAAWPFFVGGGLKAAPPSLIRPRIFSYTQPTGLPALSARGHAPMPDTPPCTRESLGLNPTRAEPCPPSAHRPVPCGTLALSALSNTRMDQLEFEEGTAPPDIRSPRCGWVTQLQPSIKTRRG